MKTLLQQGKLRLHDDKLWVVIFPQGTRMRVGELGSVHPGGAALALSARVPVIYVAHDAGKYWPKGGLIRPGVVHVTISEAHMPKTRQEVHTRFIDHLIQTNTIPPTAAPSTIDTTHK